MSTTLLEHPLIQPEKPVAIHLVPNPVEPKTVIGMLQAKAETNPLLIVFIASIIAFHLAAVMIGSVAAWVYYLRDSGAFTP
jgi:hypothetical protein